MKWHWNIIKVIQVTQDSDEEEDDDDAGMASDVDAQQQHSLSVDLIVDDIVPQTPSKYYFDGRMKSRILRN